MPNVPEGSYSFALEAAGGMQRVPRLEARGQR